MSFFLIQHKDFIYINVCTVIPTFHYFQAMNGVRSHRLEVEKVVSLHLLGQKLLVVSLQMSTHCYFNKILNGNSKESDSLPILHHNPSGSIALSS